MNDAPGQSDPLAQLPAAARDAIMRQRAKQAAAASSPQATARTDSPSRKQEAEELRELTRGYEDMIPSFDDDPDEDALSGEQQLDDLIARLDIIQAYRLFSGKMRPQVANGQRESIMISCPSSAHPDKNPSAWVNLDKQLWHCEGTKCGSDGGGVIDLVGATMGIHSPEERKGKRFHEIRRHIGARFGYEFQHAPDGRAFAIPPDPATRGAGARDGNDRQDQEVARTAGRPVRPRGTFGASRATVRTAPPDRPVEHVGEQPSSGPAQLDREDAVDAGGHKDGGDPRPGSRPDSGDSGAVPGRIGGGGSFLQRLNQRASGGTQAAAAGVHNPSRQGTGNLVGVVSKYDDDSDIPGDESIETPAAEPESPEPEQPPVSEKPGRSARKGPTRRAEPDASVTSITAAPSSDPIEGPLPDIDWREIFTEDDSFIKAYMEACCQDDVTESFHLAHALIALGFVLGRKVRLLENIPVQANLFMCLMGQTGEGKSRASRHMKKVLAEVLPYDPLQERPEGAKMITGAISGQAIIKGLRRMETTSLAGKTALEDRGWVKALLDYQEMSTLVKVTSSTFNAPMRGILFDLYDGATRTGTAAKGDEGEGYYADHPFASCLTTVQTNYLHKLMGTDDAVSGFVNRWCFFTGTPKAKIPIDLSTTDLSSATDRLQDVKDWAHLTTMPDEDVYVQWTEEGAERFTQFYHDEIGPTKQADYAGVFQRTDLLMKKLVLLMAADMREDKATLRVVEKALMFWPYLKAAYGVVESVVAMPVSKQVEEKIVYFINTYKGRGGKWKIGDGMPLGQITRKCSQSPITRGLTSDQLVRILDSMNKLGKISMVMPDGDRRRSVAYRVVNE